jgi:hypothetical protein
MSTANFAGRGGVMTRIAPHATGHEWARDGTLLRVDCERGIGWVATHYDLSLRVIQQVRGPDEVVHRVAARWGQGSKEPVEGTFTRGHEARGRVTACPVCGGRLVHRNRR